MLDQEAQWLRKASLLSTVSVQLATHFLRCWKYYLGALHIGVLRYCFRSTVVLSFSQNILPSMTTQDRHTVLITSTQAVFKELFQV